MATAYKLPFLLTWYSKGGTTIQKQNMSFFYSDRDECEKEGKTILELSESCSYLAVEFSNNKNEEKSEPILFVGSLCLNENNNTNFNYIEGEKNGWIARDTQIVLHDSTAEDKRFRVGEYIIEIKCGDISYYGKVDIKPTWLDESQWEEMVSFLEEQIEGLSLDLVRQNLGFDDDRDKEIENILPAVMYKYAVIMYFAQRKRSLIPALADIADNPRSQISTEYIYQNIQKNPNTKFDNVTMRRYITRSGNDASILVPKKQLNFDIQDNRMLRMIMEEYVTVLNDYVRAMDNQVKFMQSPDASKNPKKKPELQRRAQENLEQARKLKKITAILMAEEWYQTVQPTTNLVLPMACMLDTRYNILFRMYQAFRGDMRTEIDNLYGFSHKLSSELYEMWCFFKISEYFRKREGYKKVYEDDDDFEDVILPDLEINRTQIFKSMITNKRTTTMVLKYNPIIKACDSDGKPLACLTDNSGKHNWPDILLNVYIDADGTCKNLVKKGRYYVGSFIFEVKYRSISRVFSAKSTENSREQLIAYTRFIANEQPYFDFLLEKTRSENPVRALYVLHPTKSDYSDENAEKSDLKLGNSLTKPITFSPCGDRVFQDEQMKGVFSKLGEWLKEVEKSITELEKNSEFIDFLKKYQNIYNNDIYDQL